MDIKRKYEKKLAAHQGSENEVHNIIYYQLVVLPKKDASCFNATNLVNDFQEKDGHKDYSVPGAGVIFHWLKFYDHVSSLGM